MLKRLMCLYIITFYIPIIGYSYTTLSGEKTTADSDSITSWTLLIEARLDGLHDSAAILGVEADATPDFDSQYDRPSPPNPPGNWLQVFFPHTGGHWPMMLGTRYAADITSPDSATWLLNVESNLDSGLLTLSWDTASINKLPLGYTILMKDSAIGDTIDMRHQPSYSFQYSLLRTFSIWTVQNASILPMTSGWNLISVPRIVTDSSKLDLFPTASSPAFGYEGNYIVKDFLDVGKGYWLKFDGGRNIYISGTTCLIETLTVNAGWNIIGSISNSVPVGSIASIPPAMVTSSFFRYAGSYYPASSIDPGLGYWVRVKQNCKLILSSSDANSVEGRIRICPDAERPPAPPEGVLTGPDKELPKSMVLCQNYPNPFNPTTTIMYSLPVKSIVKLDIYNHIGQLVTNLVNGVQDAGYRQIQWNAMKIASGVYYFRLDATSLDNLDKASSQMKKMILIK